MAAQRIKRINGVSDKEFAFEVARAIHQLGGSAECQEVLRIMESALQGQLSSEAMERLDSGEVRWENRVKFVVSEMKSGGRIHRPAPHGLWTLTEQGLEALMSCEQDSRHWMNPIPFEYDCAARHIKNLLEVQSEKARNSGNSERAYNLWKTASKIDAGYIVDVERRRIRCPEELRKLILEQLASCRSIYEEISELGDL